MTDLAEQFNEFRQLVERHERFVISTHINPDGDGIGSELALAHFLRAQKKTVSIVNHSPTPVQYLFLDELNLIQQFDLSIHRGTILESDVIIVADTNQLSRLDSMAETVRRSEAAKVCIDHHLDCEQFAHLYLVDEDAASTGQIVYDLLMFLGYKPLPAEAATALYVAIMTDTGSFRFPKTTGNLHRIVAQLIDWGADPVSAYQRIFEEGTSGRLRLLGGALLSLQTSPDQKIALMILTREMFRETGTSEADAENFINYTLMIKGVQIGMLIAETGDGIKISFRSKGDIPINRLAQEFGGNGHKNAAGARVAGGALQQFIPLLMEKAKQYTIS
jgi:phosphoesterase RecJ-like protein